MNKMLAAAAFAAAATILSAPAAQADIIVGGTAGVEGDISNAYPFNLAGLRTEMRYQQVYAASEFGTSGISISAIAFRPDGRPGNASAFSTILPDVTVKISTTSASVGALSTTFSENQGADIATVFSGALALSSAYTGPVGGPKDFDIIIPFANAFFYDPSKGNLLLEVQNFGGGTTVQFDSVIDSLITSRLFNDTANDAEALTGTVGTLSIRIALVTKFITATPVPEPFTLSLFGAGLAGAAAMRRRQAKRA